MSVADDIKKNSSATFGTKWTVRDGQVVPSASDLKLTNDAVRFEIATVLYADLDQSTDLVETKKWEFAGEVYKTFLYAASRLIRHQGGTIVSYDGDRVMGVFIGDRQQNDAVSCALKINYAVKNYDNDLVWIGTAANLAAKLTSLSADQPTWITKRVYDFLDGSQKFGSKGENIWKSWKWTQHNDEAIYSSTYRSQFN